MLVRFDKKIYILFFILLVSIVAFLSFWRAFSFDFWREDWEQMWYAVIQPPLIFVKNEGFLSHPIAVFEELFLAKFFGFNPFLWQISGYILRIVDSFAIALMTLGITKSKKIAFFVGLIFASSVGGLESVTWVSTHSSALIVPLLGIGVYFWVRSAEEKSVKYYLLSLIFLLASLGDPARGLIGSFTVIFWEILSMIQHPRKVIESGRRIFILLFILLFIFLILQSFFGYAGSVSIGYSLHLVFANPVNSLNNFLTNIGNLLIGWVIPIPEDVLAVSIDNVYGRIAGYFFLFQTIFLMIHFLRKRSELFKILLFFSVWIPVLFLPNWLLANNEMVLDGKVLGMTHRYLTLSAVGLVCWLGVALSAIRNNYLKIILLLIIIISNIFTANRILKQDWFYRSTSITNPIWDSIEKDVPFGEKNSLFTFQGEDKTMVGIIAQAKVPFGIRRGIKNFEELPKSTVDSQLVKALLCGQEVGIPKIPLSHFYVWQITGNTIENISEKARKDYSGRDCDLKY